MGHVCISREALMIVSTHERVEQAAMMVARDSTSDGYAEFQHEKAKMGRGREETEDGERVEAASLLA